MKVKDPVCGMTIESTTAESHRALVEGARQAVEHHRVDDLLVTQSVAGPRAG